MSTPFIRILSPFPSEKNIILEGRGVNHTVVNTEKFMKMPYQDYHKQGVDAGFVQVFDEAAEFEPGVYQTTGIEETTGGGNTLVRIQRVETVRNRFT